MINLSFAEQSGNAKIYWVVVVFRLSQNLGLMLLSRNFKETALALNAKQKILEIKTELLVNKYSLSFEP